MQLRQQPTDYDELDKFVESNTGFLPDDFYLDGAIHRYGDQDICWYVGHEYDVKGKIIIYVTAGNWRDGTKIQWDNVSSNNDAHHQLTKSELASIQKQKAKRAKIALEAKKLLHEKARQKAVFLWQQADMANAKHPYLVNKKIEGNDCVRQSGDTLYILMTDVDGVLRNIQIIDPYGAKRFLKGGRKKGLFSLVGGNLEDATKTYIAEGFSTASSVFSYFGQTTVCAFDAGNLNPVSKSIRAKYPMTPIVIAADNDHAKEVNIGLNAAKKVQSEVSNVSVVFPEFPSHAPEGLSDFNDLINFMAEGNI